MLLAACSRDTSASPDAPTVEMPEVRIGVLGVPDVAPLHVAKRLGIFEKHGLRPKFVDSALTGDQRFDLEKGDWDLHFDSWPTNFLNIADGRDWVLIGEAYQTGKETTALLGPANSEILATRQLKGTRIGVNNPNGLGVMLINALLATVGLTKNDVEYVEISFDKLADALQRREVKSVWMIEPFLTQAQLAIGAVQIADTATGPTDTLPQSGYVCARSFAARNPLTVKAFQSALEEARIAAADPQTIQPVLVDYLKVTPQVAALMKLAAFPGPIRPVRPQRMADLMLTQGMLKKKLTVDDRVVKLG